MNRRDFLTGLGAAIAASGLLKNADARERAAENLLSGGKKRKPNIIFILADDLGYGDLSCYGQQKFQTPNIDRLATEGKRFTQTYAGSTVCAPSRCSLMTGLHQGHARVRGNRRGGVPLLPEDTTIAENLQKAGYKTAMFGKWGLGENGSTGAPNSQGFDEFLGYTDQVHAHSYYTDYLWHNDRKITVDKTKYTHDLFAQAGLDFIRQHKDEPFFLYLPFTIPHASIEVPEDSLAEFRGKFPDKPWTGGKTPYFLQQTPHAAYAAMVTRMDRDVGRITALLKELKLDEKTLVFFTSDNGPSVEGGSDPQFFQNTAGLRGVKRDLYEGGIRVPMIARWTGKIKAGQTSDQPWAFWDVLPTLAAVAEIDAPKNTDGISVLPTLTGKGKQKQHDYLYWEFYERGFQQAVRMGDWKGIRLEQGKPIELYNLRADREEKNNVAAENPSVVKQIEDIMRTAHISSPDFPENKKAAEG